MINPFTPMFWMAFACPPAYCFFYTAACMRHAAWGMSREQHATLMLQWYGFSLPVQRPQPQHQESMYDLLILMFIQEMMRYAHYHQEAARQVLQARRSQCELPAA